MDFLNYLSTWVIVLLIITSAGAAMNAKAEGTYVHQKADQSQTTISKDEPMTQAELEARGKALRQAIDAKYKELEAPGGVFSNPPNIKVAVFRQVDVTDIVAQYISIGMSFSDVTVILKAGEFDIKPMGIGTQIPINNAGIHGGLGFEASMHWFTWFSADVTSNSPDGHNVATIAAGFAKQSH